MSGTKASATPHQATASNPASPAIGGNPSFGAGGGGGSPRGPGGLPPIARGNGGGFTPDYPVLTEEVGYPPSPLANTGAGAGRSGGSNGGGRNGGLGPVVNKALQDVLGWKINPGDARGFVGALNQSFQLKTIEGAVVSTWTPRSYAVTTDLSGGVTGAQASVYTMGKTLLDQMLPLIAGLTPLNSSSDPEYVVAIRDLVVSQLNNLVTEIGYLGGPRVMRVHQYFQMLLGVGLKIKDMNHPTLEYSRRDPPKASPLYELMPDNWPPYDDHRYWTNPDTVLGSLGDLRDQLGLSESIAPSYINTIADEQNVTNFRIVIDYVNSLLNGWSNSLQFFAGSKTPFLGTQLVVLSRQLGVIAETVNEVRFVLDSVFIGPSQRETMQLVFSHVPLPQLNPQPHEFELVTALPPIYLEDMLSWMENFVGGEAQDIITNGGRFGLGEDFVRMINELYLQAYGLYLYAHASGTAVGTARVQQSINKLVHQLWDLKTFAEPVSTKYLPAQ